MKVSAWPSRESGVGIPPPNSTLKCFPEALCTSARLCTSQVYQGAVASSHLVFLGGRSRSHTARQGQGLAGTEAFGIRAPAMPSLALETDQASAFGPPRPHTGKALGVGTG